MPLICGYKGYPHIDICYNNGGDMYKELGLDESCTVTVSRREKGKYLDTENALSMEYTDSREDYASDEVFANFRAMTGGKLKENLFFRGASPCNNVHNRAPYSSSLCGDAGVQYIFDLADKKEDTEKYYADASLDCAYWKSLYENKKVFPMGLTADYMNDNFKAQAAAALKLTLTESGPYYIHCTEGKDRTGFMCLLTEALAGASLEELEADYMKTYDNYYGVTKESEPDKYKAVKDLKFDEMICLMCGTDKIEDVTDDMLKKGAENYLKDGGLTQDEIDKIAAAVTK